MPQSIEGWNWVIDRIDLNFGEVFSSLPLGSRMLDVGCGVGYLEDYLLKKGFLKIDAIDLSDEQIQVAKEKLLEHGFDHNVVNFHIADAFDYLRLAQGYDVVVMLDFLEHFTKDEIIELLQLSYRALNEDGILLLRVSNADNPIFAHYFYRDFTHETPFVPDSIHQILSIAGFKVLKVEYEKLPKIEMKGVHIRFIGRLRRWIRLAGLKVFAEFLGISHDAFTEDLIAVARK